MPEVWREHKRNSPDSVNFMLSCETPLYFLVFWDILVFRVGLAYVQLPHLLLGGGKPRMAGTVPSPILSVSSTSLVFL